MRSFILIIFISMLCNLYCEALSFSNTIIRNERELSKLENKLLLYYEKNQEFPDPTKKETYGLHVLLDEQLLRQLPKDWFSLKPEDDIFAYIYFYFVNCLAFLLPRVSIFIVLIISILLCKKPPFLKSLFLLVTMFLMLIIAWITGGLSSGIAYVRIKDPNRYLYHQIYSQYGRLSPFYYTKMKTGDAVIGSPGPDFDWHTDLSMIPSMTTDQLNNELILYDSSNGMVSGGDMIRIIHKPETNTQN